MPVLLEREKCVYTKCYCEENVWHLCKNIEEGGNKEVLSKSIVIFISNPDKTVPIWQQRASKRKDTMVIWDYHVILYVRDEGSVYDLDALLPFPCSVEEYFDKAIKCNLQMKPPFQRFMRVVPANHYLRNFASDRSHMVKQDGTLLSPAPDYPPIKTSLSENNLHKFIDTVDQSDGEYGKVYTVDDFVKEFLKTSRD